MKNPYKFFRVLPYQLLLIIGLGFAFNLESQAAPVADFTANNLFPCTSQQITFTNSSTGNITSYSWNFGSGASPATASTAGPHNVAYSTSGQKTVTLTVNGPDGPSTLTRTNYITVSSTAPVLTGSVTGNTNVCLNALAVPYSVTANSSAASYNWTAPVGGSIAGGQGTNSVTVNFGSTSGNVCVTASNGCGTGNQLCKSISVGKDRIKFMSYNLLNYPDLDGGSITADTSLRNPFFRTVISSVDPDILVVQELLSQTGLNGFLSNVMNANGNVYSAGTFINGFDTDNGILYKNSKFSFVSNTPIQTELRDINEFKLVHLLSGDTLRVYSVHLKASEAPEDEAQRAREIDSLRKKTNTLPVNSNFIVTGDFNIYNSNESAYQKLLLDNAGNEGHFIDPITLSGDWSNPAYAIYHTQSPRTRMFGGGSIGGMDDRFDLILYSKAISESGEMTYVPNSLIAYGNDGNHLNDSINQPPNSAVSQTIADALHNAADHLPVVAEFEFENSGCEFADFGSTALIAPSSPSCTDASQIIQVQIKNYGANTVNLANINVQVVVQVTNPSAGVTTLSKTVNSGSLAPGGLLTVTLDSPYNMSAAGNHVFNSYTVYAGDTASSNNSMAAVTVNVVQNTSAVITPAGPTTFCSGGSVLLNATSGSGITYQWQKNGTNIAGATSSGYTTTQSGNYTVTLQKTHNIVTNYPPATFSNNNSYNIPDNSCTGASSTINVSGYLGNVASSGITIKININHTFVGDLVGYLETPAGERLGLMNRVGSSGDNFVNTIFADAGAGQLPSSGAPYTGTYKPWTSLFTNCISSTKSTFASLNSGSINPNGNWRLLIYDRSNTTQGNIQNWQITFPGYSVSTTLVCEPVTSSPLTVTSVNPPGITFNPPSPAVCSGNAVNITASGASTYSWSPSEGLNVTTGATVTANPTSATTYTVIGTDVNGCSNTVTVTVSISQNTSVTLDPFADVCLNVSPFALTGGQPGGGTYSGTGVSGNVFNPSIAGAGTHTITYTYISGGCSGVATAPITVNPLPNATVSPAGPVSLCTGSSVTLSVPTGGTYSWSNGNTTQSIDVNSAGTFSVTVTGTNGCTATSAAVSVSQSGNSLSGTVFTETMGNSGGTVSIASHETNNGFDNDGYTMSGNGDVRVTSQSSGYPGASGLSNVFLSNTSPPMSFLISGINTSGLSNLELTFGVMKLQNAFDGSDLLVQTSTDGTNFTTHPFTLLPTGTGTATWYQRSITTGIPASSTLYMKFTQSGSSQYRIDDVSLTYAIASPSISVGGPVDFCQGSSVTLSSSQATAYLWSNGATTQNINVNASGSYYVTITGDNGCMATSNALNVTVKPTLQAVSGGGSYCQGGTGMPVTLNGSETGVNYQLKIGAANAGSPVAGTGSSISFGNQATAGTYTVTATHVSSGCTANMTGNAVVSINPLPTTFSVTGGGAYCSGGSGVSIGLSNSQNNITYVLNRNGSSTGISANGNGNAITFGSHTIAGSYTVLATNNTTGCTNTMSNNVIVSVNQNPSTQNVTGGGDYCSGGSGLPVGLDASESNVLYQLQVNNVNTGSPVAGNGNSISFGNQQSAGDYTVVATNSSTGCTSAMNNSVQVNILPEPFIANVTGGGSYCSVPGDGVPVGLSNSENDVNYQLYHDLNPVGSPVAGNGLPVSFGNLTTPGTYTVVATNTLTNCSVGMNGSVQVVQIQVNNWYQDNDEDGYGNNAVVLSACDQPAGYITDNTDCNDASPTVHPDATEICDNGIDENCNNSIDENCDEVNLHLKIFIEGFYDSNGAMRAVADPANFPLICDTIIVELRNSVSPYEVLFSITGTIDINGDGIFVFPETTRNNSYYIAVHHRNSIETWSKTAVPFTGSDVFFDFTEY